MVTLWDWCKDDMHWWYTYLPIYCKRTPIPDPEYCIPITALQGFTDAAGASMIHWGNGIGAFLPPDSWSSIQFGFRINGPGVDHLGKKLCSKMSAWELTGALLMHCSMPYRLKGR